MELLWPLAFLIDSYPRYAVARRQLCCFQEQCEGINQVAAEGTHPKS